MPYKNEFDCIVTTKEGAVIRKFSLTPEKYVDYVNSDQVKITVETTAHITMQGGYVLWGTVGDHHLWCRGPQNATS